jgi:hypothetical protein
MMRMAHTFICGALLAGAGVLAALPAQAQGMYNPGQTGFHPVTKAPADAPPKETPPAALPGAQISKDAVTPSDRPASDLAPTEALFDAVNRGDIAAARDALNRGADLNGRNVLDMTPLELSVDLARNDITFLLLSLRGVSAAPPPAATAESAPAKPGAAHPARVAAQAKTAVQVKVAVQAKTRVRPQLVAAPVAAPVRQFAGRANPGTPVPQAGFLGFGGSAQP